MSLADKPFLDKRINKACDFCTNKLNSRADFWGCIICKQCAAKTTATKFEGLHFNYSEQSKLKENTKLVK